MGKTEGEGGYTNSGNLGYKNNLSGKESFVPFCWVEVSNGNLVMIQGGQGKKVGW